MCSYTGYNPIFRYPDTLNNDKLEETIIEGWEDINVNISEKNIEVCHRQPVRRNAANVGKRVIVKFVNRKHTGSVLYKKNLPRALRFF